MPRVEFGGCIQRDVYSRLSHKKISRVDVGYEHRPFRPCG
jgi:hypothetical protein